MHALIAAQAASVFSCFSSPGYLRHVRAANTLPTGFSAERLLTLETVAQSAQPSVYWGPGGRTSADGARCRRVALAAWPLLSGDVEQLHSVNGAPSSSVLAFFLSVSPGWLDAMKIPGRR